jgi:large subunit ribosomal protein L25
MAVALKVKAEPRSGRGTSTARRLRRTGVIPAVVYGVGKAPQTVQVNTRDFTRGLQAQESEHVIMDLEISGSGAVKCLLQDVQHHAVTGDIIHADFHEISLTEKLRVKVPLRLVGDPVGVSQQGGVLDTLVREIEIECLPLDIPEHIDLDISQIHVGQSLKAGDVKLGDKLKLVTDKNLAVVAVTAQRAEEEAAPAAAEGAAEPEVLREKKPEEGEEAAKGDAKAGAKAEAKPAAGAKAEAKPAAKK